MTERLVAGHLFHCAKGHNAHANDRAAIAMSASCPPYPQKRTLPANSWMSALCQKRTHALQQFRGFYRARFVRQVSGTAVQNRARPEAAMAAKLRKAAL
jgi:hypothetical protein